MDEKVIYHICQREAWEQAQDAGEYRVGSLEIEGFIHCSELNQVAIVANFLYKDVPDLVLLHIETEKVDRKIIYEKVDNQMFPHIYGPINLKSVVRVTTFEKNEFGEFETSNFQG